MSQETLFEIDDVCTRICTRCGIEKHFDEFYNTPLGKYGKFARCAKCCEKVRAESQAKRPEYYAHIHRNQKWRSAGIKNPDGTQFTNDDYDKLVKKNGDMCQCCGKTEKDGQNKTHWTVDHDHNTGIVRGLICFTCNIGIGNLGDTLEGVKQALTYLEKHYVKHRRSNQKSS